MCMHIHTKDTVRIIIRVISYRARNNTGVIAIIVGYIVIATCCYLHFMKRYHLMKTY